MFDQYVERCYQHPEILQIRLLIATELIITAEISGNSGSPPLSCLATAASPSGTCGRGTPGLPRRSSLWQPNVSCVPCVEGCVRAGGACVSGAVGCDKLKRLRVRWTCTALGLAAVENPRFALWMDASIALFCELPVPGLSLTLSRTN